MTRPFKTLLLVLALASAGACTQEKSESTDKDLIDGILSRANNKSEVLRDQTVGSVFMGQTMKYSVYLPGGYSAEKSYPFLYLLHGAGGNQNSWLDDGTAQTIADNFLKRDSAVPFVIIMPDGQMTFFQGDWERYFHEELIPLVEASYSCNGKRAIAGLSMGGYGTLYHALYYPDKFLYAHAMSPAVFGDMSRPLSSGKTFPSFTLEVGTEDYVVDNSAAKSLYEAMEEAGVSCEWIERAGFHEWGFWRACLPGTLEKAGSFFK